MVTRAEVDIGTYLIASNIVAIKPHHRERAQHLMAGVSLSLSLQSRRDSGCMQLLGPYLGGFSYETSELHANSHLNKASEPIAFLEDAQGSPRSISPNR